MIWREGGREVGRWVCPPPCPLECTSPVAAAPLLYHSPCFQAPLSQLSLVSGNNFLSASLRASCQPESPHASLIIPYSLFVSLTLFSPLSVAPSLKSPGLNHLETNCVSCWDPDRYAYFIQELTLNHMLHLVQGEDQNCLPIGNVVATGCFSRFTLEIASLFLGSMLAVRFLNLSMEGKECLSASSAMLAKTLLIIT